MLFALKSIYICQTLHFKSLGYLIKNAITPKCLDVFFKDMGDHMIL